MWAIVDIGNKQYLVKKGQRLNVELLGQEEGEIIFDKVLLASDDTDAAVGTPYIKGATVKAVVEGRDIGPKVISYSYRRRKKSRKIRGHRQKYNVIKITEISA